VRVNPETYIVEGAESLAWARRSYRSLNLPKRSGLPGAWAHIEASEGADGTGEAHWQPCAWSARALGCEGRLKRLGVKGQWESDPPVVAMKPAKEARGRRVGGAKGRAEQGAWWGER
jgi:hypothetical protein